MKPSDIKISVIVSAYNSEKYLKEAIDSILNQRFGDFELIVCDDASADSTPDILRSYGDPRLKVIINAANKGLTYNLNYMLTLCQGKYIARMDADDIALPQRLERQYSFMEAHPEVGVCGTCTEVFYQGEQRSQMVLFPEDDLDVRAFAFFQSPFCHPSVMIRRETLTKHHLQYPPQYKKGQDYGLWIEMLKYAQGANLQEVLLRFRRHDECVSNWEEGKLKDKIAMLSSLHRSYLSYYNIPLSDEEGFVYSRFVDRSVPSDLSSAQQKQVTAILGNIQNRLAAQNKPLSVRWRHHLAMVCFYNFVSSKRIPRTFFLWKLFLKGGIIYTKRIIKI